MIGCLAVAAIALAAASDRPRGSGAARRLSISRRRPAGRHLGVTVGRPVPRRRDRTMSGSPADWPRRPSHQGHRRRGNLERHHASTTSRGASLQPADSWQDRGPKARGRCCLAKRTRTCSRGGASESPTPAAEPRPRQRTLVSVSSQAGTNLQSPERSPDQGRRRCRPGNPRTPVPPAAGLTNPLRFKSALAETRKSSRTTDRRPGRAGAVPAVLNGQDPARGRGPVPLHRPQRAASCRGQCAGL